jgi:hypothetical protein
MPFINAFGGKFGQIMQDHHGGKHVGELPHAGSHPSAPPTEGQAHINGNVTSSKPAPPRYTVHTVPGRGLIKHPMHEIRDSSGRVAATVESRPSAERLASRLNNHDQERPSTTSTREAPPVPDLFRQMEQSRQRQIELGIGDAAEVRPRWH